MYELVGYDEYGDPVAGWQDDYGGTVGREDIVGAGGFVGDELEMLLGLVPRPGHRRGPPAVQRGGRGQVSPALANALANRRAQQGRIVHEAAPTKDREFAMGLDSVVTVAAGATVIITNRPQVLFRVDQLIISTAIAGSFVVNDFKVGKDSQFAASGALPADMFTPNSFRVTLKCDTAQISNDVAINITNISNAALRFMAGVVGPAVQ